MKPMQLVVQFPASSLADVDDLMALEGRLIAALGIGHHVSGRDFGSGTASIFIDTRDVVAALAVVEPVTAAWGATQWSVVEEAFADDDQRRIWPIGSSAGLSTATIVARSGLAGIVAGAFFGLLLGAVLGGYVYTGALGGLFGAVIGFPPGIILGGALALWVRAQPHRRTTIRGSVAALAMPVTYLLFTLMAENESLPLAVSPAVAIILLIVALATWLLIPVVLHQAPPTWQRSPAEARSSSLRD